MKAVTLVVAAAVAAVASDSSQCIAQQVTVEPGSPSATTTLSALCSPTRTALITGRTGTISKLTFELREPEPDAAPKR